MDNKMPMIRARERVDYERYCAQCGSALIKVRTEFLGFDRWNGLKEFRDIYECPNKSRFFNKHDQLVGSTYYG